MSEFSHKPIMLMQCIEGLNINPEGIYVDGTCGGAGHSKEIAKRITTGKLYGLDQDPDAVAVAELTEKSRQSRIEKYISDKGTPLKTAATPPYLIKD